MFYTLLLTTFVLSVAVSFLAATVFKKPCLAILQRVIGDPISSGWATFLRFSQYVVGIASGVRIHELERYISPAQFGQNTKVLELTQERWVLEVYRTIIGSLQGIAWVLLVFFLVALIAFVIVRGVEAKAHSREGPQA